MNDKVCGNWHGILVITYANIAICASIVYRFPFLVSKLCILTIIL